MKWLAIQNSNIGIKSPMVTISVINYWSWRGGRGNTTHTPCWQKKYTQDKLDKVCIFKYLSRIPSFSRWIYNTWISKLGVFIDPYMERIFLETPQIWFPLTCFSYYLNIYTICICFLFKSILFQIEAFFHNLVSSLTPKMKRVSSGLSLCSSSFMQHVSQFWVPTTCSQLYSKYPTLWTCQLMAEAD